MTTQQQLVRVETKVIQGKKGTFKQYTVFVGSHKVLFVSEFDNSVIVKSVKPLSVPEQGFALIRRYDKI